MSGRNKILVIGSSNTDLIVRTKNFPIPGETVIGDHFFIGGGGKGANQAVAAQRFGGDVIFVTKIGDDIFGEQTIDRLKNEGINVDNIVVDIDLPSGIALITVNDSGENTIVVSSGANSSLNPEDFTIDVVQLNEIEIVLLQLEIPIPTIIHWIEFFKSAGKKVILNPAPAIQLPSHIYDNLYLITPNEIEASIIANIKPGQNISIEEIALILRDKGIQNVVITLGADGAYLLSDAFNDYIPGLKVDVIDTTGAGDTFNGALSVLLSENYCLPNAVRYACQAASLSVSRQGAQNSMPYRHELEF